MPIDMEPAVRIKGEAIRQAAERLRTTLDEVVLDQDQIKSRWRKLVIQSPLSDTISKKNTHGEQAQAIYDRFTE